MQESLHLKAVAGPPVRDIEVQPGAVAVLGRSTNADVRLDSPSVSRLHLRVDGLDGRWQATDLGSRHGSKLNGRAMRPESSSVLAKGDMLEVGPWTFAVNSPPAVDPPRLIAPSPAQTQAEPLDRAAYEPLGTRWITDLQAALRRTDGSPGRIAGEIAAFLASNLGASAVLRPTESSRMICLAPADGPGFKIPAGLVELAERFGAARTSLDGRTLSCVRAGPRHAPFGYIVATADDSHTELLLTVADLAHAELLARETERARVRDALRAQTTDTARLVQRRASPPPQGQQGGTSYSLLALPGESPSDAVALAWLGDNRFRVAVASVAARQIGPAVALGWLSTALNRCLLEGETPAAAIDTLSRWSRAVLGSTEFVYLTVAEVDPHRLQWSTAGGPVPVVIRSEPRVPSGPTSGGATMPLGLDPTSRAELSTEPLGAGCRVVLVSAGTVRGLGAESETKLDSDLLLPFLLETTDPDEDVMSLERAVRDRREQSSAGADAGVSLHRADTTMLSVSVRSDSAGSAS